MSLKDHLRKHALKPWFATAMTLLVLVAGVFGSLYGAEIRRGLGGLPAPSPRVAASGFLLLVLGAGFLFFTRQQEVDRSRRDAEQRLENKTRDLVDVIRTQPPRDFLALFATIYDQCEKSHDAALRCSGADPEGDRRSVERWIRQVLRGLAILAQRFDGEPEEDGDYATNLMVFVPASEAIGLPEIRGRLRFCDEEELDMSKLLGVLDLALELSTTAISQDEPDAELVPLALPIPRKAQDDFRKPGEPRPRLRVLPGAPLAFVSREMELYTDTRNIGTWMTTEGDFTWQIKEEVERYFLNDERPIVRSFASLPLVRSQSDRREPVAVLNFHRSQDGLFSRRDPKAQFVPLIRPIQLQLVRMLDHWRTLSGS